MTEPSSAFRVLLRMQIRPGVTEDFEKTWLEIGSGVTDHPANLGQWLARSEDEEDVYYITSDWTDEPRFREFEHSAAHLSHRERLHPFRSGGSMSTMRVVYTMTGAAKTASHAPGLAGKRVLVTGGTRGIGRETALAFARAGASVVAAHHSPEDDGLAGELGALGDEHHVIRADVTKDPDVAALMAVCERELGGLDVVVNNVGVDGRTKFGELTVEGWDDIIETNLGSGFLVTQQALKLLSDHGSVVNVGASAAVRGRPESAHYGASKAAVHGLTRSLARELGSRGIRVNTVLPGVIETTPGAGLPLAVADMIRAITSLGRLGRTSDVAATVLFLASDASAYISGAAIPVDGGI